MDFDLQQCIREWKNAREQFLTKAGRAALHRYAESNHRLYVAFVEGCENVEVSVMTKAFHIFRELLSEQVDHGNWRRAHYHPVPSVPARA